MAIIPDEYLIDYNKYKEAHKEFKILDNSHFNKQFEMKIYAPNDRGELEVVIDLFEMDRLIKELSRESEELKERVKQLEDKLNDLEEDSAEVNS